MSYLKCILIIRVHRIYREINNSFVFKYRRNTFFFWLYSVICRFQFLIHFRIWLDFSSANNTLSACTFLLRVVYSLVFFTEARLYRENECFIFVIATAEYIPGEGKGTDRAHIHAHRSSRFEISSARVEIPDRGQPSWNWRFSNRPKLSFARKNHCHASEQMARHSRARVWHGVYHEGWNDQICPNQDLNASIVDEILRYVCISKRFRLCKREVYSVFRSENRFYQRRLTLQPLVWLILSICF